MGNPHKRAVEAEVSGALASQGFCFNIISLILLHIPPEYVRKNPPWGQEPPPHPRRRNPQVSKTPNGFAYVTMDNKVCVYSNGTGAEQLPPGNVSSIAVSGNYLAVASIDTIYVCTTPLGNLRRLAFEPRDYDEGIVKVLSSTQGFVVIDDAQNVTTIRPVEGVFRAVFTDGGVRVDRTQQRGYAVVSEGLVILRPDALFELYTQKWDSIALNIEKWLVDTPHIRGIFSFSGVLCVAYEYWRGKNGGVSNKNADRLRLLLFEDGLDSKPREISPGLGKDWAGDVVGLSARRVAVLMNDGVQIWSGREDSSYCQQTLPVLDSLTELSDGSLVGTSEGEFFFWC